MDRAPEVAMEMLQKREVKPVARLIDEAWLSIVPTLHDVQRITGNMGTSASGHADPTLESKRRTTQPIKNPTASRFPRKFDCVPFYAGTNLSATPLLQ